MQVGGGEDSLKKRRCLSPRRKKGRGRCLLENSGRHSRALMMPQPRGTRVVPAFASPRFTLSRIYGRTMLPCDDFYFGVQRRSVQFVGGGTAPIQRFWRWRRPTTRRRFPLHILRQPIQEEHGLGRLLLEAPRTCPREIVRKGGWNGSGRGRKRVIHRNLLVVSIQRAISRRLIGRHPHCDGASCGGRQPVPRESHHRRRRLYPHHGLRSDQRSIRRSNIIHTRGSILWHSDGHKLRGSGLPLGRGYTICYNGVRR